MAMEVPVNELQMADEIVPSQNKILSERSKELLELAGKIKPRGKSIHDLIKEGIAAALKDVGYSVKTECHLLNGGRADVRAVKKNEEVIIEIQDTHIPGWFLAKLKRNPYANLSTLASDMTQPKQVIEVMSEPEREHEAPISSKKLLEVTLSKAFETELRMFLINRQQQALRLEIDLERMEVIRIVD